MTDKPRYSAELWIDADGTTNFKWHIEGGNFSQARVVLKKFIACLQERLNNEGRCPMNPDNRHGKGRGHPYSTKEAKIQWLIDHPHVWANAYIDAKTAIPQDVATQRRLKREICRQFREARMVYPKSTCIDVDIPGIMDEALERMKNNARAAKSRGNAEVV